MSNRRRAAEQRDRGVFAFVAVIVAVAAVLASSGVVGPELPATADPAPVAAVAPVVVGDAVGGTHDANAVDLAPSDAAARAEAPPAATTAAELPVHVRRAFGGRSVHYTGPLAVLAAGEPLLRAELVNQLPVRCVPPAACRELTFVADGCAPAVLNVGEARKRRVVDVVLLPDVGVEVEVLGAPAAANGTWFLAVQTEHLDTGACERPLDTATGGAASRVPLAAGVGFHWQAKLVVDSTRMHFGGVEPALAAGEWRRLRLDLQSQRTQRYRVVGPSPELLPHLELRYSWTAGGVTRDDRVALAADGGCELAATASDFTVGDLQLRSEVQGAEVLLHLQQPLVGIGLREVEGEGVDAGDGKVVASSLFAADGEVLSFRKELHVLARERAEAGLWMGDRFGSKGCRVDAATLRGRGDLVWLLRNVAAAAMGTLRVHVRGTAPAAELATRVRLVAFAADGQRTPIVVGEDVVDAALPAGAGYRLQWQLPGDRSVAVASELEVRAEAVTSVTATWPAFELWTGEVEGRATMPKERRWHRVVWGDGDPWPRAMVLHPDRETFEVALLAGERLEAPCQLCYARTWVPARVEVRDAARRSFVVQATGAMRWVELEAEAPAPWTAFAWSATADNMPIVHMSHDNRYAVAVASGRAVHGVLVQNGLVEQQRALAWWTLDGSADLVRVRPAAGRWLELRPVAARANRAAVLVGPHGQRDMGCDLSALAPVRVWAPDGTRGVAVFDGYAMAQTRREIALGSGDLVIVD